MKAYVTEVEVALFQLLDRFYNLKEREELLRTGARIAPILTLVRGGKGDPPDDGEDPGDFGFFDSSD